MEVCRQQQPPLVPFAGNSEHLVACHLDEDMRKRTAEELSATMMAQIS
jgi:hypothetical protein